MELRGGVDTDVVVVEAETQEMEEEIVEFLVKEEETIVDWKAFLFHLIVELHR